MHHDDKWLLNCLHHLEDEQKALVAIAPDEAAVLINAGYVERRGLRLTEAGRAKLAELVAS